jgi:hypothetical protein
MRFFGDASGVTAFIVAAAALMVRPYMATSGPKLVVFISERKRGDLEADSSDLLRSNDRAAAPIRQVTLFVCKNAVPKSQF